MSDYDYEPVDNSPYLKIEEGKKVKLRIASKPIHFTESFTDQKTGETKESERFAWVVLVRDTGKVKAFKSGVLIYKIIKDLAENEDWGDPKEYDLTIENTGELGSRYYIVTPSPKKAPLTTEELAMIMGENLDLEKLFKATDRGTNTFGGKKEKETDTGLKAPKPEGDPLGLDSIPF